MKRTIIILTSICMAAFAGCSKSGNGIDHTTEIPTAEIKGKTLVSTNVDGQISLQYTADKKISEMTKIAANGDEQKTTFTHEAGKSSYLLTISLQG